MGKILKKVVSDRLNGEKGKKKNAKCNYKLVENLISGDFKSSEFEEIIEEVAAIVYSRICQLSKIYQTDSISINNLLKGASYNA